MATTSEHERRGPGSAERGVAMLGMLLTVIVLGVMAVVVLNSLNKSPASSGITTTLPGATTTTQPATAAAGAQEAAVSACQVNYLAIETVLGEYRALNGALPPAGSAWATSPTHGGPYLQQWPESVRYYTITWNGDELSVSPARGVASHGSYGTHTPVTGCFAAQQRWAAP